MASTIHSFTVKAFESPLINACAYGIPRAQAMSPLRAIFKSLRIRAVQRSLSIWRPPEPEFAFLPLQVAIIIVYIIKL